MKKFEKDFCEKEDCNKEIFEKELHEWEEKEGAKDPFEEHECRKHEKRIDCSCVRKSKFIVRDIDFKECELILNTCDCDDIELCDGQPFEFVICPCVPRDGCRPRQVFIKVGCNKFPLVDRIGDFVFENQITNKKIYFGYYGADPRHAISFNVVRVPRW